MPKHNAFNTSIGGQRHKNRLDPKILLTTTAVIYIRPEDVVWPKRQEQTQTRQHWIQRITFTEETNAALRRAVTAGKTDRQTQTPTTTISSPLAKRHGEGKNPSKPFKGNRTVHVKLKNCR